jgi:hypothetical protein
MFMKEGNIHISSGGDGDGDGGHRRYGKGVSFFLLLSLLPHITLPSFFSDLLGGFFSVLRGVLGGSSWWWYGLA